MFVPTQDGIARDAGRVHYGESAPPEHLQGLVHTFWELRTLAPLPEPFLYQALPDACVNLLLNQLDLEVAGVTALRTSALTLDLGRSFHFVGIQLWPGVWQGGPDTTVAAYVGDRYTGPLPLLETNRRMAGLGFSDQLPILTELVEACLELGCVAVHPVVSRILGRHDRIGSVEEMAAVACLSTRQLRRVLRAAMGLSPHDFLKILRVQQSFRRPYLELYADQAHFIRSFREATGYTPTRYRARFRGPGG